MPWADLVMLIGPYAPEGKRGRPPFAVEAMLRIHFLQQGSACTVAVNTEEQQAIQMLHRIRQRLMQERTALINQARGLLGEYGIVFRIHVSAFKEGARRLLADEGDALPALARELLHDMCTELTALEERIDALDGRVRRLAKEDERCARLQAVPGIGPVTATALIAAVGDAKRYRSARHMAASFGLTPHEHSSGGKQKLLGISKRGDRYVRWLLVQGARSISCDLRASEPMRFRAGSVTSRADVG